MVLLQSHPETIRPVALDFPLPADIIEGVGDEGTTLGDLGLNDLGLEVLELANDLSGDLVTLLWENLDGAICDCKEAETNLESFLDNLDVLGIADSTFFGVSFVYFKHDLYGSFSVPPLVIDVREELACVYWDSKAEADNICSFCFKLGDLAVGSCKLRSSSFISKRFLVGVSGSICITWSWDSGDGKWW